jgi:methyl-accepting chemotaxis protein
VILNLKKPYGFRIDNPSLTLKELKLIYSIIAKADRLKSVVLTFKETNKKAVTHLNYAYRGLVNQLPALKEVFDESVKQFTRDVGKAGGVLDQHYTYLVARQKLYDNIASLAVKVDESMSILGSFNDTASAQLNVSLEEAGVVYEEGYVKAIGIGIVVCAIALGTGYHVAHSVREPLTRILATLEALTAGDMTKRIDIYPSDLKMLGSARIARISNKTPI